MDLMDVQVVATLDVSGRAPIHVGSHAATSHLRAIIYSNQFSRAKKKVQSTKLAFI
jgi:hypothetical protein